MQWSVRVAGNTPESECGRVGAVAVVSEGGGRGVFVLAVHPDADLVPAALPPPPQSVAHVHAHAQRAPHPRAFQRK